MVQLKAEVSPVCAAQYDFVCVVFFYISALALTVPAKESKESLHFISSFLLICKSINDMIIFGLTTVFYFPWDRC